MIKFRKYGLAKMDMKYIYGIIKNYSKIHQWK